MPSASIPIDAIRAAAYRVPTDAPEGDGTLDWHATTLVAVSVQAGGQTGLGFTYSDAAIVSLILGLLREAVQGRNALDIADIWVAMQRRVRNLGRAGLVATAISAIDSALWDVKARLLDVSLATLLGRCRQSVPVYGSGGFTPYSDERLTRQLCDWVEKDGCRFVKMKIGRHPDRDPHRIAVAKAAAGDAQLFVDANGAFSAQQALGLVAQCREADIRWFEEPVSSDDLAGLALVRQRAPDGMDIAAGEYIFAADEARRMLEAGAVDVLQADVTRCGGITGFLKIAALCEAFHVDLSGHCAPSMHAQVACATPPLRHLEWFHDHVRIEQMLFDGAPMVSDGMIRPDFDRPGHGLSFRQADAADFLVAGDMS